MQERIEALSKDKRWRERFIKCGKDHPGSKSRPSIPKRLKAYTPVPLKPYKPVPLKAYTPVPVKPYKPAPLKNYTPAPVKPYKPVPKKNVHL